MDIYRDSRPLTRRTGRRTVRGGRPRQNEQRKTRRLTMPVLAIGGAASFGEHVGEAVQAVADEVQSVVMTRASLRGTYRAPAISMPRCGRVRPMGLAAAARLTVAKPPPCRVRLYGATACGALVGPSTVTVDSVRKRSLSIRSSRGFA